MRIHICWTEISGYTAACWRELAARPGVDLSILAWPSKFSRSGTQFDRDLMAGLPVRFLEEHEQQDGDAVAQLVADYRPDILLMGGWAERPYRNLVWNSALGNSRMVLAMDTPWKGTLRQRLARFKIGRYIDRLDAIFVPGQRGVRFAQHLWMPLERIFTGMLGFDFRLFEKTLEKRLAAPWPKRFVYLGRYSIEKALDTMVLGYALYRESVADPWPLECHGSGRMQYQLENQKGIEVHGWAHPADQPEILARQGFFVLTSRTDAWGVALAEAMASGLPAICTDAVGAAPDLIQNEQNGLIVRTNVPTAIAKAMKWIHEHYEKLPAMGQAARAAAAPYSAQNWAQRFLEMAMKLQEMPIRRKNSLGGMGNGTPLPVVLWCRRPRLLLQRQARRSHHNPPRATGYRSPCHPNQSNTAPMPPTLSIITPSYNQAQFLDQTLRSVIAQRDQVHEYFVYDGGSTDGSADLIKTYSADITHWVSEKDAGQSDVLKRGFARATGDYLAWLNSDDVYLPGALAKVRAALSEHPQWDVVTGWHTRIDGNSRIISANRVGGESRAAARWGSFHPCQPTVFFRRSLYEKVGGVNPELHLVMDTELFFRMMDAGAVWGHVPAYLAAFRRHGESKGVGTHQKYASEYQFLDGRYPHYHAKSAKHYLGRAMSKGLRTLSPNQLASRRDTRNWRGKTLEEVFGPLLTNQTKPADNQSSSIKTIST